MTIQFRGAVIDPANPEKVRLFQSVVWRSPNRRNYAVLSTEEAVMQGPDAIPAVYEQLGCLAVPSPLGTAPFAVVDPAASAAVRRVIAKDLLRRVQT